MNTENLFILATWKFESLNEIINNKNYHLNDTIYKIALFLKKQRLSETDLLILSNHNWNAIEVEDLLEEATTRELENYIITQKKEWDILNFENDSSQTFSYDDNKVSKTSKKDNNYDFLFNEN